MNDLNTILQIFEPIALDEMESVKLLNRVDSKYAIPSSSIVDILHQLSENYRVLEVNGIRSHQYTTVYYDTHDFALYHQHHNGKMNRYKVRMRRYEDSDVNFFELKFKSNKKRTIKQRIVCSDFSKKIKGKKRRFLSAKSPIDAEILNPKITVHYQRITLVSKQLDERLTIDIDLWFENETEKSNYNNLVIAEIKRAANVRSKAAELLHLHHINKMSLSKYCLGISSLYSDVKTNNFKEKFRDINKICYEKH